MANLHPGQIIALRCLGEIERPRFLDGRTFDGSVGLFNNTELPFTGTKWLVGRHSSNIVLLCLGDKSGPKVLDGRTGNGTVGLAGTIAPPFSGTAWEVRDAGGSAVYLRCLGQVEGPRFLDGRTAPASVGPAPNVERPFSGTRWEIEDYGSIAPSIDNSLNGRDVSVRGTRFDPYEEIHTRYSYDGTADASDPSSPLEYGNGERDYVCDEGGNFMYDFVASVVPTYVGVNAVNKYAGFDPVTKTYSV